MISTLPTAWCLSVLKSNHKKRPWEEKVFTSLESSFLHIGGRDFDSSSGIVAYLLVNGQKLDPISERNMFLGQ